MKEKLSKIVKMFGIPKLILVMAAGVVLIALSAGDLFQSSSSKPQGLTGASIENKEEVSSTGNYTTDTEYVSQLEKSLISTLSCVSGVGKVEVMITLQSTSEKITLKDLPYSSSDKSEADASGGTREENSYTSDESTVFEEDGNNKSPYVVKEIEPVVKGVVVVAEGGGSATIKKEIIEAVQVLFEIESHKIKVMKLE